jgi:hypothetical protein
MRACFCQAEEHERKSEQLADGVGALFYGPPLEQGQQQHRHRRQARA